MSNLLTSRGFVPTCILIGLILRAVAAWLIPVDLTSDAEWYAARAVDLANGLGYQESGHPTAFWAVGWPGILGFTYWLTGSIPLSTAILNLLGAGITMGAIAWIGRYWLNDQRITALAVLGYAIYPSHIAYASIAMNETFYAAVFCSAIACLLIGRRSLLGLIVAGVLFGFATLIKAQTYAFPIGAIVALWIADKDFRFGHFAKAALVVNLVMFAVILPWSFRNYQALGNFVLVSSNGGSVMYYSANPEATGQYMDLVDLYPKLGMDWDKRVSHQIEHDKIFRDAALSWIKSNPAEYVAMMPSKLAMFWSKDADGFWHHEKSYPNKTKTILALKVMNQLYFVLILLLAIPCLFAALRSLSNVSDPNRRLLFLFCVPAFVSLLAMVLAGITRYHYPAMPFMMLAAAWTLARWAPALRKP